jgi:predicted aldo/keto reductase-like oxidoreductase
LQANVAAALDKIELSIQDKRLLKRHARETAFGYCAGCANLCESVVKGNVPISDIMRYAMYYYNYGDHERAIRRFNTIPDTTRRRLASVDYSRAEYFCPQNIPITKLMKKAVETLAKSEMG